MAKTLLFSEYCLSSPVVGNLRNVTKCCWSKPRVGKGVQGGLRGCKGAGPGFWAARPGRFARCWEEEMGSNYPNCFLHLWPLSSRLSPARGGPGHPAPWDLGDTPIPNRPAYPSALQLGNRMGSSGAEP